jgi:tetratricopeptide (TPR) repeat protein
MIHDDYPDYDFDIEQLLNDSVEEILKHEDRQKFFQWMRTNIRKYFSMPEGMSEAQTEQYFRTLAMGSAYAVWNAMPLPGKNFSPDPLPPPKRNDPCPCGSGKKYKQCCLQTPAGPELDTESLWHILVEKLPAENIREAARKRKVPLYVLNAVARDYLSKGRPGKAAALLEPCFAETICSTGYDADAVFNTLVDCYDELNHRKKKDNFIAAIIGKAPKSPLRSGAWQRLASIRMDAGDNEGAWQAFEGARKDNPDDPSIGALEINLLLAERRVAQARERADFWLRRVRKQGLPEDHPICEFFETAREDPDGLLADFMIGMADGAGEGLKKWLAGVRDRPLPSYGLISMGRSIQEAGDEKHGGMRQLSLPFKGTETAGEPEPEEFPDSGEEFIIAPPDQLARMEKKWHRLFPLAKPFSVHSQPFGDEDPWESDAEKTWTGFLFQHPEAYDSIDILDDLAAALEMHPGLEIGWSGASLVEPILERSRRMVEQAVAAHGGPVLLPWLIEENRPALRNLARLITLFQMDGRDEAAYEASARLLELNPGDNHGFRGPVINHLLRTGRNREALDLGNRFPGDMLPETVLGRVLALFRLGRKDEAARALSAAMEHHAKTVRFLWRARVKKPKMHEYGVRIGGDDQAWLYREEMRDVWAAEPGALEWLRREAKQS